MVRIAHQLPQFTQPWGEPYAKCGRCRRWLRDHALVVRYEDEQQAYVCPSGIDSLYEALEDFDTFLEEGWEG